MMGMYGKHRGVVVRNEDPLRMGRLEVRIPSLLGEGGTTWAMPSVPYAGRQVGMVFLPPVGAGVWVEFEAGDTDLPIWTGCYWNRGEFPSAVTSASVRLLRTEAMSLEVKDGSGAAVTLELIPPAARSPTRIVLDGAGVTITHGSSSVKLTASGVSVNDGALEVT